MSKTKINKRNLVVDMNKRYIFYILLIVSFFLFLGVFNLPYGYYQFLRVLVTFSTIYIILYLWNIQEKNYLIIYVFIFLLFNPFLPVNLNKFIWILIDIIVCVFYIVTAFKLKNIK